MRADYVDAYLVSSTAAAAAGALLAARDANAESAGDCPPANDEATEDATLNERCD